MKFVESILSNNTTDDHCQEFVTQKGLLPLVSILGLPNLPIDFPTSAACQAVAGVCKSILVSMLTELGECSKDTLKYKYHHFWSCEEPYFNWSVEKMSRIDKMLLL